MFRVFLSLGDRPDRSLKGIEMNGQTVVDPVASTSGAMTAADTTDWWAPVTQFGPVRTSLAEVFREVIKDEDETEVAR